MSEQYHLQMKFCQQVNADDMKSTTNAMYVWILKNSHEGLFLGQFCQLPNQ